MFAQLLVQTVYNLCRLITIYFANIIKISNQMAILTSVLERASQYTYMVIINIKDYNKYKRI